MAEKTSTCFSDPSCHTDTINFTGSREGTRFSSTSRVAVFVVLIIFLLVIAVCRILTCYSTASSPPESNTSSNTSEEAPGCPPEWERHGEKCYFFSPSQEIKDWNASRRECTDMDSDLVIIDNVDELNYLFSRWGGYDYLLGLTYSAREMKWKWINNMEYNSATFKIEGDQLDYFCTVVGHGTIVTTSCSGSKTTKNMCEKAANILEE